MKRNPLWYLQNICVGPALMGLAVLRVLEEDFVHVSAGILEQAVGAVKDDEGDFAVAQHAQFVCLFHQTKLAFGERHLRNHINSHLEH